MKQQQYYKTATEICYETKAEYSGEIMDVETKLPV
jgi:hypothetical protein